MILFLLIVYVYMNNEVELFSFTFIERPDSKSTTNGDRRVFSCDKVIFGCTQNSTHTFMCVEYVDDNKALHFSV